MENTIHSSKNNISELDQKIQIISNINISEPEDLKPYRILCTGQDAQGDIEIVSIRFLVYLHIFLHKFYTYLKILASYELSKQIKCAAF